MKRCIAICILLAGCGTSFTVNGDATDDPGSDRVDTVTDSAVDTAVDTGIPPPSCWPQQAWDDGCIDCTVAEYFGAAWDGIACRDVWGCRCAGEDCGRLSSSMEECGASHTMCDGALCVGTGGLWRPSDPCGPCGHLTCGVPNPEPCCSEGCDCGPGRSFFRGVGCLEDPSCTKGDLCIATGGTWYPADPCGPCGDYHCGMPSMLPCCDAGCDCGPGRSFTEGEGCRVDSTCPEDRGGICTFTGGTWHPADPCGPCGDYFCGMPSMDDCCDAGCDCGPLRVFDPGIGCTESADCLYREEHEYCTGSGASSTCRPGLVCCMTCEGSYCQSCMPPCCAESPYCMEDGCPPPPP